MWFRLGISGCELNQLFRKSPKLRVHRFLFRIPIDAENTGEDTDHISVQNRTGLVERDAAYCAGGVATNAGEIKHVFEGGWELTTVPCQDQARSFLHVAHARVIPKAFPQLMDFLRAGFGKGMNRR